MDEVRNSLIQLGFNETAVMPRFVGDWDFYTSCLQSFLEEDEISQLKKTLEDNDSHESFKHLHALKGVVGNLGLMRMYDDICVMVEKFRNNNTENWQPDFEKVTNDYKILTSIKF